MTQLPAYVDQAYAFAHGRIGVLQQLLLNRSDVDRLLGSHDLHDAEKILTELRLTTQIPQGVNREEDVLDLVSLWVRSEVEHMSPEGKVDVFGVLWMESDAPLLSYLLKQHFGLTSSISHEPKSALSSLDPTLVRQYLAEGKSDILPEQLMVFIQEMLKKESPTPMEIDAAVSQYIATRQLELARRSGSYGIQQFTRHNIDVRNIRTALRLLDSTSTERMSELLTGGSVKPSALNGDRASIARAVEEAGLGYGLAALIRKQETDWNDMERALSDVLAEDVAVLWNVPLSVEPLFAFAALTLSQLGLLRVLLIGKRSGLSPQEIKKILPPFIPATHYVL
jgi:hypothetical protein